MLLAYHSDKLSPSFLRASHDLPSHESGLSLDLRLQLRNASQLFPCHRSRTYSLYTPAGIAEARDSPRSGGVPRTVRIPSARHRAVAPALVRAKVILYRNKLDNIANVGPCERHGVGHQVRAALRQPRVNHDPNNCVLVTPRHRGWGAVSFLHGSAPLPSAQTGL